MNPQEELAAYNKWLSDNADKKDTSDYATVLSRAQELLASAPTAPTQPVEQASNQPGFIEYAGEAATKIPQGVGQFLTRGEGLGLVAEGVKAAGMALNTPSAKRTVPPILASVMFPPSAPAMVGIASRVPLLAALPETGPMVAAGLSQGAAAFVGSQLAGDSNSEAVKNAVISSYAGRGIKPNQALFMPGFKEAAKETAIQSGLLAGAETLRKSMEAGALTAPYTNVTEMFDDLKFTPMTGIFTGALRAVSGKAAYQKELVDKARYQFGKFIDADSLTLGMIDPQNYANIESRIAQTDPELARQIYGLGATVTDRYNKLFGNIAHPASIAKEINKYAGRADEEAKTLERLKLASEKAQADFDAIQNMPHSPADVDRLKNNIIAAKAAEINQQARYQFWDTLNKSTQNNIPTSDVVAKQFTSSINDIFELRSEAAKVAYEAAGVPFKEKFIPVKELIKAARRATSSRKGPIADAMIARLNQEGGKDGLISVNQMRDMRRSFSDVFATADENQMDNIEAIAKLAYSAITNKTNSIIENQFGKDVAGAFADVNAWWGKTANAANSRYLRQLSAAEPSKTMVQTLASDLAKGDKQNINKFIELIDAVSEQAPDVAKLGRDALHKTLREGMIINASAGQSSIDFEKLTKALNNAASRDFDISVLGFGNKKQLSQVLAAYKEYGANGARVTAQELDEFYSNPLVREQIAAGANISGIASRAAARGAFERGVKTQLLADLTEAKVSSNAYRNAQLKAERAGVDLLEQQKIAAKVRSNPVFAAFEGKNIGEISGQAGSISKMFQELDPKDARQIFEAFSKNKPKLAEKIERRIVADLLEYSTSDKKNPGQIWSLDINKLNEMFNPALQDKGNPIHLLKEIMPRDKFRQFKSSLYAFNNMSDYYKYGGQADISKDMMTLFGTAGALAASRPGSVAGATGLSTRLFNLADGIKYNTAAWLMLDPKASKAYFSGTNFAGDVSRIAPDIWMSVREDKELMNELGYNSNQPAQPQQTPPR